jgi:hypothetical protein
MQALIEAHTSQETEHMLDEFVAGKGLGLIILLQYSHRPHISSGANPLASRPTSVGKTLKAV